MMNWDQKNETHLNVNEYKLNKFDDGPKPF